MPEGLLWLGLTLLGALQTQARDATPNLIPAPPLSKVPPQPNFQDDQVRGLAERPCGGPGQSGSGREERQSLKEPVRTGWAQASAQPARGSPDGSHAPCLHPHPDLADLPRSALSPTISVVHAKWEQLRSLCMMRKLRLRGTSWPLAQGHPIPARPRASPACWPPAPAGSASAGQVPA